MISTFGVLVDIKKKRWSFPLSEHGKLIQAMECLKPNVTIGALPLHILKVGPSLFIYRLPVHKIEAQKL